MAKRKMRERSLGQTAIPGQKDIAEKSLEACTELGVTEAEYWKAKRTISVK